MTATPQHEKRKQRRRRQRLSIFYSARANFLTGLVVVAPVLLTFYLIWTVVGFIDGFVLPWVPEIYQPSRYIGINIKGYGVVIFLFFTIAVGAVTKGFFGRSLLRWGEGVVDRMPVVRSIYNGVKQIVETILNQTNGTFEKPCLIEYPRKGIWAVAFVSTTTKGEILEKVPEDEMLSVFLPTTPNPTSGFLLFLPKRDVMILDMDVESAAKLVISAGLVHPPTQEEIEALKAQREQRSFGSGS